MFEIDTGETQDGKPYAKSRGTEGLRIDLTNYTRAERLHRQVIENIYACETQDILADYLDDEAPLLEAMASKWPHLHASVIDAAETHRACVV